MPPASAMADNSGSGFQRVTELAECYWDRGCAAIPVVRPSNSALEELVFPRLDES